MPFSEFAENGMPPGLLIDELIAEAAVNLLRFLSSVPLLLTAVVLTGIAPYLQAGDYPQELSEAQVKATYIRKFEKYATWPPEAIAKGAPMEIGIIGAPAVAQELESWNAIAANDRRPIKVKRLQWGDSLEGVNILFIGSDKPEETDEWLSRIQGKPVLAVTDVESRMPMGSMINFVHDSGRVRFDVSLTAAERSRITLSAALLTVARQVYGGKT